MLLLHKPGTNPTNLKHDSVAEMAEFVDSEFCPVTVKQDFTKTMYDEGDPALEKDVIDNDDQLLPDPLNRQEPTVMQDDWMQVLGGQVLQENINNQDDNQDELVEDDDPDADYSDLSTDPNFNYSEDREYLGLTNIDIKNAADWIARKKIEVTIEATWNRVYNCDSLNSKQREVFDAVQPIVEAYLAGEKPSTQFLMDVSGGAGTGKSTLIRTIVQDIERRTGISTLTKVAAFTNSAASHFIGGQTLHRLFRIDVSRGDSKNQAEKNVKPLCGDRLAVLQNELRDVILIIIDEKSVTPDILVQT